MDILPANFAILKYCGVWTDREYNNFIMRALQFSYRFAITILIYHLTISELIELMLSLDDIGRFTESLFICVSFVGLCIKFINFDMRKKELLILLNLFRSDVFQASDPTESQIITKYKDKVKRYTLAYLTICQVTGCAMALGPLLEVKSVEHALPLKVYQPYSISNILVYLAVYIQQTAAIIYGIAINVSFDSLVYGFCLLTCGQLELLSHRFKKIYGNESFDGDTKSALRRHLLIRDWIKHHLLLYEVVDRIQSLFMSTIALFFFLSMIILCTTIFQISKYPVMSIEFMTVCGYLMCMSFQVFSYCWFGNELELKSKSVANGVYFSNWTSATPRERRSLLFIIKMSQRGLILSYYGVIVVAVHTFMWIIKTSYSTFNLLQQVSN